MNSTFSVPWKHRLARAVMSPLFRGVFHLISQVKITGLENVPTRGAYLIVFNHVSIYDPPFLIAFWPVHPEVLGAVDIWSRPGQDLLARLYGGIPIHRGEVDRAAMERMLIILRAERPLLLAPEGGRSHEPGMRQAKPGIVYLVERTQVPVVPVGIVGTTDDFFQKALHFDRPCLELRIGQPFTFPALDSSDCSPKAARQRKADYIMERISALLPPSYRGVYGHG
ncbi:MAG: lysophospholipid acyltransferase family protein [Anaerolineaceae bacterium]|nr:lysophospholipid acyltransferase family protein [Anaerolineaceae bacterium]